MGKRRAQNLLFICFAFFWCFQRLKNFLLGGFSEGCHRKNDQGVLREKSGKNYTLLLTVSLVTWWSPRFLEAQVMELIHLQEDLERDGFPSGVGHLDVAFWWTHFAFCGPKIVEPETPCQTWSFRHVRPSKQCPEGLVWPVAWSYMLDMTQNSSRFQYFSHLLIQLLNINRPRESWSGGLRLRKKLIISWDFCPCS